MTHSVQDPALLAAIVASSDVAILSSDLHGVITSWNAAAEALYGWSTAEALGRPVLQVLRPERPEDIDDVLSTVQAGGTPDGYEVNVCQHKDGRPLHVAQTVSVLRDVDGQVIGGLSVGRDLAADLAREAASLAATAYARSLVELSPDALITVDLQAQVTDVNEATERLTGRTRADLVGRSVLDLFTDAEAVRIGMAEVLTVGLATDYPLTFRHVDGTLTEVLFNATAMHDATGATTGLLGSARDVTALRNAETFVATQRAADLDRLAELERFQSLTVGRELKMIELKREIEDLRSMLAQAP